MNVTINTVQLESVLWAGFVTSALQHIRRISAGADLQSVPPPPSPTERAAEEAVLGSNHRRRAGLGRGAIA